MNSKSFLIGWLDSVFLAFLHSMHSARVTGSFGRGDPHNGSDLDVRLSEKDLKSVKEWLTSNGKLWDSEMPGHITYDGVEMFTMFRRMPKRLASVQINGLRFRTH